MNSVAYSEMVQSATTCIWLGIAVGVVGLVVVGYFAIRSL